MSGEVSISHPTIGKVNFSGLNATVQYVMNNPLFVIPVGGGNQGVINLALLSIRINVTFDLIDGITKTTSDFDKLMRMSRVLTGSTSTNILTFIWGDRSFIVSIESFVAGTQPGKFNYLPGCSITLVPTLESP